MKGRVLRIGVAVMVACGLTLWDWADSTTRENTGRGMVAQVRTGRH